MRASRARWLLWLDRLSVTTRSPGTSVGTSTSLTVHQEALAVDGAIEHPGRGHAAQPQSAMSVVLLAMAVREAVFVTRLQPSQLPDQTARQLPPEQSTTLRVESSCAGATRRRGALRNAG